MVNKNYIAGRRFEYKVKHLLERKGYTVLRTSGSHGFADLVAVKNDYNARIIFIQCKNRKATKEEIEKLNKFAWLNTPILDNEFTDIQLRVSLLMIDPNNLDTLPL